MSMAGFAAPIARVFGPIPIRVESRVDGHDLLALLKVRTIHAVLVTLLVVMQYWFQVASSLSDQPRLLFEFFFGSFIWNVWQFGVGFAIIAVVQTRLAPGRARTMILLFAMLVWALLWALWHVFEAGSHFHDYLVVEVGLFSRAVMAVNGLWTTTTYLLLAAWYYESADRAKRTRAALRESELARRSAERWLLELRLGALQARLDPQVLFDTLDEASRLYRSLPAAAEDLLDALIDYLRLALPQLRQAESTLAREVALAIAYARVLRAPDGDLLDLDSDVTASVEDACFPPMVVQPLCDALARSALASGPPTRMHFSASRQSDDARLCITAQAVRTAPGNERLAEIRRTLESMFASEVRMEVTFPATGVARVLVEVPYVAAPRVDR